MRDKDSLYLAAGSAGKQLLREHQLRRRAGLPGDFLDHAMLLDVFGIARAGAIVSSGAADADPMQLARGLLRTAVARGARVFEGEAVEFDAAARSVGQDEIVRGVERVAGVEQIGRHVDVVNVCVSENHGRCFLCVWRREAAHLGAVESSFRADRDRR